MSTSQFDDVTKKMDRHFEKTGVVLVGMHQELQEQKHRINQYHEKVDAVTADLTARSEELLADLRVRAHAAVAALDDVEPVIDRLAALTRKAEATIQDTELSIESAGDEVRNSRNAFQAEASALIDAVAASLQSFEDRAQAILAESSKRNGDVITNFIRDAATIRSDFVGDANQFFGELRTAAESMTAMAGVFTSDVKSAIGQFEYRQSTFLNEMRTEEARQREQFGRDISDALQHSTETVGTFSSDMEELLTASKHQQTAAVDASVGHYRDAVKALGDWHANLVSTTDAGLKTAISSAATALYEKIGEHRALMRNAHDALQQRQAQYDMAFKALKDEIAQHQLRQAVFAKQTRFAVAAIVIAGVGARLKLPSCAR
jgi:ABC-type transporter Mla subunit MlaD